VINDKYNLEVSQIDAYWLQTELNKNFNDPLMAQKMEIEIMKVLCVTHDIECENKLVNLLSHEKFDLIKLLLKNRFKLYFCTRLGRAQVFKN
jgi:pre-mRNA-splicing helicase BRR2